MIFDAILQGVFGLLGAVLGWLPAFTAPSFAVAGDDPVMCPVEAMCTAGDHVAVLAEWVDLSLLVGIVSVLAGVLGVAAVGAGLVWLYERLPGKGS